MSEEGSDGTDIVRIGSILGVVRSCPPCSTRAPEGLGLTETFLEMISSGTGAGSVLWSPTSPAPGPSWMTLMTLSGISSVCDAPRELCVCLCC